MNLDIKNRNGFEPLVINSTDDLIGIVTVHDGPSLNSGEIIAPTVGDNPEDESTYHNNFQIPDRFLAAGGRRGRQLQVLVEGTYFINRLFATIDLIKKTVIEVGMVGVVVSYTGNKGNDLSGDEYRHGELISEGNRGVWQTPLMPNKYALNTFAYKVEIVPTTNIILKWIKNEEGDHKYDANLTEVSLITKDAFEPSLPLSVVLHIDYKKAPLVIQRFGDVRKLVEQTLDPMVSAYFKNIGQTKTLIELIQERSQIQKNSSDEMKEKFNHYNLELEEVLIGTPSAEEGDERMETILNQLRDRQVAVEKIETYSRQQLAAVEERKLREAEARAKQQTLITESELNIEIQSNRGKATLQEAIQESEKVRVMANAESKKIARLGIAQALSTEEQVNAYGGANYQVAKEVMSQLAVAVKEAGVAIVPNMVINSGDGKNTTENVFTALLSTFLNQMGGEGSKKVANPQTAKIKESILQTLSAVKEVTPPATEKVAPTPVVKEVKPQEETGTVENIAPVEEKNTPSLQEMIDSLPPTPTQKYKGKSSKR